MPVSREFLLWETIQIMSLCGSRLNFVNYHPHIPDKSLYGTCLKSGKTLQGTCLQARLYQGTCLNFTHTNAQFKTIFPKTTKASLCIASLNQSSINILEILAYLLPRYLHFLSNLISHSYQLTNTNQLAKVSVAL